MAFPPEILDEIRARIAPSALVGKSVKLQRRGREFVGLSPFSNEKSPSFTVNDEKQFYHCFSTGEHGDIFTFLMKTQSLSFPEAVARLAEEAGVALPVSSPEEREAQDYRDRLREVAEAGCAFFEEALKSGPGRIARDYLARREISEETARRFRLGYAPEGGALKKALMARGYTEKELIEVRLVSPGRDGRESFDFFRGRLMFPILDSRGRPVAFGGRVLGDGEPKYLNSPETPLFNKGSMVYGLSLARKPSAEKREIIVCEGYMDVIALAQAGFENAVAPLGTALTERQVQLLWPIAPEPVLCFDGDKAGQRAALKAADRILPILSPGVSLRFAMLPLGQDPDDLVRAQGPGAMEQVLKSALPMSDIVWHLLTQGGQFDTPERRAALERDGEAMVRRIEDPSVQNHYRQLLRERVRETFYAPKSKSGPTSKSGFRPKGLRGRRSFGPPPRPPGAPSGPLPARLLQERILLAAIMGHSALLERVSERLGSVEFADSNLDSLRRAILFETATQPSLDSSELVTILTDKGFERELAALRSSQVTTLAGFVRPDAPFEEASQGWDHTFELLGQSDVAQEQRRTAEVFAEDDSEEVRAQMNVFVDRDIFTQD